MLQRAPPWKLFASFDVIEIVLRNGGRRSRAWRRSSFCKKELISFRPSPRAVRSSSSRAVESHTPGRVGVFCFFCDNRDVLRPETESNPQQKAWARSAKLLYTLLNAPWRADDVIVWEIFFRYKSRIYERPQLLQVSLHRFNPVHK